MTSFDEGFTSFNAFMTLFDKGFTSFDGEFTLTDIEITYTNGGLTRPFRGYVGFLGVWVGKNAGY